MTPIQLQLLEVLIQHPLLSPDQLGVLAAAHPNHVRDELKPLRAAGWIERINPRSPSIEPRAVFYPTPKGVRLASRESQALGAPSFARLVHLWLALERVYHVRNLILRLRQRWSVLEWNVEVDESFRLRGGETSIHLHGVGIAKVNQAAIPFIVEYDSGQVPLSAKRMTKMMHWRLDPRFGSRAFQALSDSADRRTGCEPLDGLLRLPTQRGARSGLAASARLPDHHAQPLPTKESPIQFGIRR